MIAPYTKCTHPSSDRLAVSDPLDPGAPGRGINNPKNDTKGVCKIQPSRPIAAGGMSHKTPSTGVGMSNPPRVILAPTRIAEGRY